MHFFSMDRIMIEFDPEPLSKALRSCDIASVGSAVTDLKTCLGSIPAMRDLIAVMSRGFEAVFEAHLVNCELSQELSARAHDLADQRCSVLNWSRPATTAMRSV